ncbi:MAG: hypothetical protein VX899_09565 [Myxococcota bacterium]|nr:hypothetical protein [Myxococcota bacterium]
MPCILVLTRPRPGAPPPPEAWPMGRAALALEPQGIRLRFGDLRAVPGGWTACTDTPVAIFDRYPSWTHPSDYQAALARFPGVPVVNSPAVQALCRDKLATQRALEAAGVPMPPVSETPSQDLLAQWGGGFLKPRYGGLGRGVRHVLPGDALPPTLLGATGHPEPAILQAPVLPPAGQPFVSYRALVQRTPEATSMTSSGWTVCPIVARVGGSPVVNVDLGAAAEPACDRLPQAQYEEMERLAIQAAAALADDHTAELGVDLLLGQHGPVVIEVNGVPKGRGAILAQRDPERFGDAHQEALLRPMRWLSGFQRISVCD